MERADEGPVHILLLGENAEVTGVPFYAWLFYPLNILFDSWPSFIKVNSDIKQCADVSTFCSQMPCLLNESAGPSDGPRCSKACLFEGTRTKAISQYAAYLSNFSSVQAGSS